MRRALLAAALAVLVLAGGGCGGSGSTDTTTTAPVAAVYRQRADAVCGEMLRQTKRLGREFIARANGEFNPPTMLVLQTNLLVKPGLRVLRRTARQLRAVAAESGDPNLSLYASLYEPLIQLGELRLQAGREGDTGEAQNLQIQMEELGIEQRQLARLIGLSDCRIDFLHALVSSWSRG